MGVPSYFAWILRKFNERVLYSKKPSFFEENGLDILYLDFNCAIHADARSRPDLPAGRELYQSIFNYFLKIVDEAQPAEKIFIAIDGVPPVAKIDQQRIRRYKAVKEEKSKREIAQKHGVTLESKPDYNMISPGTVFMEELSEYFQERLSSIREENPKFQDLEIIFSPSNVPGEGEHKIISHLSEMGEEIRNKNIAIYGLDSDMIFLSLLHIFLPKELYLMREEIEFNGGSKTRLGVFNYLDVKKLGHILVEQLRPFNQESNLDSLTDVQTVLDYTYICLFVGNDFLPHFPSLKIRDGGLQKILETYSQVASETGEFLITGQILNDQLTGYQTDKTKINMNFLKRFIRLLANDENSDLKAQNQKIISRNKKFNERLKDIKDPYEKELERLYYVENRYSSEIGLGNERWRQRYYQHHFDLNYRNKKEFKKSLQPICQEYFRTMNWCFVYYLHGSDSNHVYNNTWFYRHDATPTLLDLSEFLDDNFSSESQVSLTEIAPSSNWENITPLEQLILILPPQSISLLPEEVRKIINSLELGHLFPENVKLNLANVTYWWESHPFLPTVTPKDRQKIKENLEIIQELPDSSETIKKLNSIMWENFYY